MKPFWLAGVAIALVLIGCAGIRVSQDYDPATNFGPLSTYDWAAPTQEKTGDWRIDNPLQDARIRAAVDRVLTEKGFRRASDAAPTVRVRYQYMLRRKLESDASGGGIGFGVGSYGRYGGVAFGTGGGVREYDEASLIIDLADPATDALLWRGSGTHRYTEYDDPFKATAAIDQLVEKILAQFPPHI